MDTTGNTLPRETSTAVVQHIFPGDGEMARLMRAMDWAQTPLGPVEAWPQSLRTIISVCLASRFPILIWWGPDLVMLYNDAYREIIAAKHPHALGAPGRSVFPEIWDVIGPMLESVLQGGNATWSDDQLLPLERNGYAEECYFTFSYSPIRDESGGFGGVFCAVTETTARVLAERHTRAARDVSAAIVDAHTADEVCQRAARALASDVADVPFALLYLLDADRQRAHLAGTSGLPISAPFAPAEVSLAEDLDEGDPWSIGRVARSNQREVVANLAACVDDEVARASGFARPECAVILPVTEPGQSVPSAVLIAGVSPMRALDDRYEGFFELLASHLSAGLAAAHAYEEERKRAEALDEIDRAKTAFFNNVSHEFRTPLTLVLGPLEDLLAHNEALPVAVAAELERMRRNGVRLLKLVNTLLDFARIEAGRVQAVYEPTDLATYTAELASSFRSLIERAGMRLVVDCPPLDGTLREPVYIDREMWEKVVLNLLSNAFKFTFDGAIAVALAPVEGGRAVELVVRDTGVGIPASELPRLFERFHRIEGTRARTHEGSGIGLALAQELVRLHGGTVRVQSAEGAGTTFFVRVPVGAAHLPAERVRATSALNSTALGTEAYVGEAARWLAGAPERADDDTLADERGTTPAPPDLNERHARPSATATPTTAGEQQRASILLADDNADMREYLVRLLRGHYRVEAVANGAQALAAIERTRPDLVLADVMMPELDGFGLLRALRSDPQTLNLPVILLSARAGEEATVEGLAAGADDYLIKPFSAREVLSRVASRLEVARTRTEAERQMHEALTALLGMAEALAVPPENAVAEATEHTQLATTAEGTPDVARTWRVEAVRRVLALVQRVFGSQCTAATVTNLEADTIDPLAVVGLTAQLEERFLADMRRTPVSGYLPPPLMERLADGEVIELDLSDQPPVPGQDYWGLQRLMVVAQRLPDGRFCVIGIETRDRPGFTPRERDLARAAVRLVALVVERERLWHEREQARANELVLREANRRMDEFLGIASHELRTPLTSITANVQMASKHLNETNGSHARASTGESGDGAQSDGTRRRLGQTELLLERTERQLKRMDRLVSDLIDVSRIQAGKLELRPEACDLIAIVREAVDEQRAAWPERGITCALPRRHTTLPIIADADRIGQAVTNYLTNALKYSANTQPVEVRVSAHKHVARVEVRDSGPGLTPEQRTQLFERFYRVPGIEQQSGSGVGLGLGLHICQTMVERHGGQVGVESAPGQGSTFWFTLPLATAAISEHTIG